MNRGRGFFLKLFLILTVFGCLTQTPASAKTINVKDLKETIKANQTRQEVQKIESAQEANKVLKLKRPPSTVVVTAGPGRNE